MKMTVNRLTTLFRYSGWLHKAANVSCVCLLVLLAANPVGAEEAQGPTHLSLEEYVQSVMRCGQGFAKAKAVTPENRAAMVTVACAGAILEPDCRRAFEALDQVSADKRPESIVRACAAAYCPKLPEPKPELCTTGRLDDRSVYDDKDPAYLLFGAALKSQLDRVAAPAAAKDLRPGWREQLETFHDFLAWAIVGTHWPLYFYVDGAKPATAGSERHEAAGKKFKAMFKTGDHAEPEESVPPRRSISVSVGRNHLLVEGKAVLPLTCGNDQQPCTEATLEALDRWAHGKGGERPAGGQLSIAAIHKEAKNPNSLIIVPLHDSLAGVLEDYVASRKASGKTVDEEGLFIQMTFHPAIPYRLLAEVIYTIGKVGATARVSLRGFKFLTRKPDGRTTSAFGSERHLERLKEEGITLPTRGVRSSNGPDLPEVGTNPRLQRQVTVLIERKRLILKLHTAGGDATEEIILKRKVTTCRPKDSCGDCTGPEAMEHDWAALYNRLVELKEGKGLAGVESINVSAEDDVPWRDLSALTGTVTAYRAKNAYRDLCEFERALPALLEEKSSGQNGPGTPAGLFSKIVFLIL
jgi:hypothetical protein